MGFGWTGGAPATLASFCDFSLSSFLVTQFLRKFADRLAIHKLLVSPPHYSVYVGVGWRSPRPESAKENLKFLQKNPHIRMRLEKITDKLISTSIRKK